MKRARRHHIVPQFILRRFADEDGNVVVYDVEADKEWSGSVRKIAVENDFYTVETPEGPSDLAEEALAKIEGLAAAAIDRVLGGSFPPDNDDRQAISAFLALQCSAPQTYSHLQSRRATNMGPPVLVSRHELGTTL
jgi:hypothetical protein